MNPLSLIAIAALVTTACGGGGGGGGANHPPELSGLIVPSTVTARRVPALQTVRGTVDFRDSGGDIDRVRIAIDGGPFVETPVASGGAREGKLIGAVQVVVGPPAQHTIEVWALDANGAESNHLSGTIAVAPDRTASSWGAPASGTTATLRAVATIGSRVVVVGDATILTSEDLTTWTPRQMPVTARLNGVASSGTTLVAVGDAGAIFTSTDGIVWAARTSPVPDSVLAAVTWAGTQFVAVGGVHRSVGGVSLGDTPLALTSPDGITWTDHVVLPNARASLTAVAGSGSRLVAVGWSDVQPVETPVAASDDGITWTSVALPGPSFWSMFGVGWNGHEFLATGAQGSAFASSDGILWAARPSVTLSNAYAVTWTGERWVATGLDGIASSRDAVTWIGGSPGATLRGVAWTGLECVAVGDAGAIRVSPAP